MPKLLKNPAILLSALCFLAVGCGPVDDRMEITGERVLPKGQGAPELGKTLRERIMPKPRMSPGSVEPAGGGGEPEITAEDLFKWDTPDGWKQQAPRGRMRMINFSFGENDEGECYMTILPGAGGGLQANIGRWYGQMGLVQPSPEEVEKLPETEILSRKVVAVDIEGTFSGMGKKPLPGARLVGRMTVPDTVGDSSFSMTIKMTGPADLVEANLKQFEQFCDSLRPGARTGG